VDFLECRSHALTPSKSESPNRKKLQAQETNERTKQNKKLSFLKKEETDLNEEIQETNAILKCKKNSFSLNHTL
jgi:hypothetical protein